MDKKQKASQIYSYLDSLFPNACCELKYNKDYELVIAVMLSAQTTDKSVNKVTEVLFDKYKNLDELSLASIEDIKDIIRSIGLYKNKAKNLKGIVDLLINKYNYKVPSDEKELVTLPGVGEKTAGVIRAEIFNIPDLPVDTHVSRVSKRLGLVNKNDDPSAIEKKLKKIIPEDKWIKSHHRFIHFGRYICLAKNPHCEECRLKEFCKEYK